ncbi:MAG: hypothetical protein IJ677_01820 [Alphaproteobacteria bacterium]|nr:hypothetical protein [Alphaproteobacteria bacterium]
MGWFLTIVIVLAVFNAEKLPALRQLLEEKLKNSMDAAKEGSKIAKDKIKQVKTDIENKKNAPETQEAEAEENTPEEIEESLKFMGDFIKSETKEENKVNSETTEETKTEMPKEEKTAEDAPIDLEHRY